MAEDLVSDGYSQAPLATGAKGNEANVHVLSYSFNQDYSCFVCGTTVDFRVFTTSPVCEVKRRKVSDEQAPIVGQKAAAAQLSVSLVRMLFNTNLFLMTTVPADGPIDPANGPTKIQIWDEKKAQFIAVLRARYEVKGVVIGRDVIVMVCEKAVYIYRGDKLSIILHFTTTRNERGLCALAAQGKLWLLACPGQTDGTIRVQVGQDEANCCIIQAHKAPLAGLAVTASGSLIASASEWGTVVQVHSRNGDLVHRLRRSTRQAIVTSMAFRADDRFLAVGSSSNTVHVFRIDAEHVQELCQGPEEEEDTTPARGTAETVGGIVMGAVPGYFVEPRSIGTFRIPDTDMGLDVRGSSSTILGPQVGFRGSEPCLLVLHYNGLLYEVGFNEDSEAGDERVCQAATTWFAVRPDFKMSAPTAKMQTVAGGATEDDEEEDPWMVVG